jgi:ligand-binding sensor domain-containing protein/serine phosphatase RsbU (regulator of sigma subunit)
MRCKHLISLVLLLLGCLEANAQQYNFLRYSIEEGLPRSGVYCVYEDQDGFLWVGVEGGGVCVFDGQNFSTYNTTDGLASNTVRTIFQDDKGYMWLGTQGGGLTKYDGLKFSNISSSSGLSNDIVRAITQDNEGNLWVGTFGGGVTKFSFKGNNQEIDRITIYNTENGLPNDRVRCMLKDSEGHIWIGTDGGLCRYDGKTFTSFTTAHGLPNDRILCLYEDGGKNIWSGTQKGACRFDGSTFTTLNADDGLIQNRVRAIAQDHLGNMWFGTKSGASKYDGVSFQSFNEDQGLSNSRIRSMILDSSGNLWFGTFFGGINKYSGTQFIHYTAKDGLVNDQILSISSSADDVLWLGTFAGAERLAIDETGHPIETSFHRADSLITAEVHDIVEDQFSLRWFATDEGLLVFNGDALVMPEMKDLLTSDKITSLYEAEKGVMWIGTEEGLSRAVYRDGTLTDASFTNYTLADNLNGVHVSDFYEDPFGQLWIAFADGGITIAQHDTFTHAVFPQKLANVIALTADENGMLWIATEGSGVFKWNGTALRNYTTKDGLASNNAYLLEFDDNGNLWVGSEKGLSRVTVNDREEVVECKHFGRDEGFQGIETNPNAVHKDKNGNLWVGTIKGLTVFNPLSQSRNEIESKTHITAVKLFAEEIKWTASEYCEDVRGRFQLPELLVLPYNQNHVSFDFVGISLKIPSKVRYRWKLDGFDAAMSAPSPKHDVTYTNLPFGQYTFQVISCNEDGIWNASPTVFSFEIEAPFWRTTWFYIVCIILGSSIFLSISQWRVKRLRTAKHELEVKVLVATKELRKEKELVDVQKEKIEQQNDRLENTNSLLEEKNTSITDSITYAQRIQSAIMQPKQEESSHLQQNMFVFYRPKDIVSGDFYWYSEQEHRTFVAAADCTGHGVPGAFMSMIGITFLNEIVNEKKVSDPAIILDQLRSNVIEALSTEGQEQTKDGMDIALLSIDWDSKTLEYAGAHNPLYIVRKDKELIEYKPDKMPIGVHDNSNKPFTNHKIDLKTGDMVYVFSDGYVDQFGGPKLKKFLAKRFKALLLTIKDQPIADQQKAVEQNFFDWMGVQEQVDDILVIGIRI